MAKRFAMRLESGQEIGLTTVKDPDTGTATIGLVVGFGDPPQQTVVSLNKREAGMIEDWLAAWAKVHA